MLFEARIYSLSLLLIRSDTNLKETNNDLSIDFFFRSRQPNQILSLWSLMQNIWIALDWLQSHCSNNDFLKKEEKKNRIE